MARKLNAYCMDRLKTLEGLRLVPYLDSAGVATDGYGNTEGVVMGRTITKEKAERDLARNVDKASSAVERAVKVPLNDFQFGALVIFVFNVGIEAFRTSTLLRLLNAGDYEAVPAQMMRWNKVTDPRTRKKVVNKGLTNRRSAEIGIWARDSYVASASKVPVKPASLARSRTMQGAAVSTAGTVGLALTDASYQISAVSEFSDSLRVLFVILALTGAGLTIYGRVRIRNSDGV